MYIDDVEELRKKFELPIASEPTLLDRETLQFRVKFLMEEVSELVKAHNDRDLVAAADAIVDIVYVAFGGALEMGLPFDALWNAVHEANMLKIKVDPENLGKRGHIHDLAKPADWVSPEIRIAGILGVSYE
jgi:predicted HAD superfamily Cof-like phosphohydrolase